MARFYSEGRLVVGELVALDRDQRRHAAQVLRLTEGAFVELINGAGDLAFGVLRTDGVEIQRIERMPPSHSVGLAFGLTKSPSLEFIFRRCTELGVAFFQPLDTDFSLRYPKWNSERWQRLL